MEPPATPATAGGSRGLSGSITPRHPALESELSPGSLTGCTDPRVLFLAALGMLLLPCEE